MLPQLSFILAQAGADAHLPPLSGSSSSSNTRHSPQPSSSLSQHVLPPPPAHPPLFTSSSSSSSPTPSDHQLPPLAFLKWRDTERPVLPPPSSLWRTSPPPSAQPVASSSFSAAAAPAEPSLTERAPIYDYDPYHSQYETHWDQDEQDDDENKRSRRVRESNDLLTQMNNEFWDNCEVIYKSKLEALQEELRSIQKGTHEEFLEQVSDLEKKRDEDIINAEIFKDNQLTGLKRRYEDDVKMADQEYETEKTSLYDTLMAAIDERRKMIKEDREISTDLFNDAYSRINNQRRTLRKRGNVASPSRHENTRRRQNRNNSSHSQHSIHAGPSSREKDELELDFLMMKGSK